MASTSLGPDLVICPFTVLVDTREQKPYSFDAIPAINQDRGRRWLVPIEYRGLKTGDYSIAGLEDRIAIERKSLVDLYGTLGSGRERFENEVERLAAMDFAAVVIEATMREIWRPAEFHPNWRSRLDPRSVEGTIIAWSQRYRTVQWWAMDTARQAEIRTFFALEMFWRKVNHESATKQENRDVNR